MQQIDWASRWSEGRIGFHQSAVSDFLHKYSERAWGPDSIGRVYVPLCGKSLDMVFLAERATEVVGVELVEQAVSEFFAERGLDPEVEVGPPLHYAAGGFSIFAADIFSLTVEELGSIDAVFDRAALVALPPETRGRYADHMRSIMPVGARMLLVAFEYDQSEMSGPPFAVLPDEVERLYADGFDIEHLETREVPGAAFRDQGVSTMRQAAYVITRK